MRVCRALSALFRSFFNVRRARSPKKHSANVDGDDTESSDDASNDNDASSSGAGAKPSPPSTSAPAAPLHPPPPPPADGTQPPPPPVVDGAQPPPPLPPADVVTRSPSLGKLQKVPPLAPAVTPAMAALISPRKRAGSASVGEGVSRAASATSLASDAEQLGRQRNADGNKSTSSLTSSMTRAAPPAAALLARQGSSSSFKVAARAAPTAGGG